jgi:NodT family efflux transporter outer membrane factor (OMF) lipoprotein
MANSVRLLNTRRTPTAGSLAALACLVLAACVPANGPLPRPHSEAGPAPVAANSAASLPATPGAQWPGEGWWHRFGDPQLDALIEEGIAGSSDLAAAVARLRKSAAMAGEARAALLPTVDARGSAGESRVTLNQGFPQVFKDFLPHGWNDSGELSASLGFDPDLFGANRARLAAARREREAAAIEALAARLTIATAIAEAYVDLAGLIATRDLRQAAAENREQTRKLVADRRDQGLDNLSTLRLAESEAAVARGDLALAEEAVLLRRHQLAALLGAGPDRGLAIQTPRLAAVTPAPLPDSVTTGLAGRRPDIAAARARMEGEAARVRAARADFFPDVRLTALAGVQAVGLGLLFDRDSQFGNATGAVSLPIFHGGALKARYAGARADYDAAVADYDRTVVAAYQQLADAVATRGALTRRDAESRAALSASEDALRIARLRYRAGLGTFLDVLVIEGRATDARLRRAQIDTQWRSAEIALVRALGGGFDAASPAGSGPDPAARPVPIQPSSGTPTHE